ncbi:MAG: hypothetical protein IKO42_02615 [Opitutales bacterium]|nr:hypothetical protein [Opitutales bacterium]
MKILLIFPTIFEAGAFFKKSRHRAFLGACAHLDIGGVGFHAIVSGIGCGASAERVKAFAFETKPDIAILCGFCGACVENIKEGGILFETANAEISRIFGELNFTRAKIASVGEVANSRKKEELGAAGFAGVEMESGFFGKFFEPEKFVHLRAVSDSMRSKIPAEFFDSMMDKSTGASSFSLSKFLKMWIKNPMLPARLVQFAVSAGGAKKAYDAALMLALEKIADFYLQNGGKNGNL